MSDSDSRVCIKRSWERSIRRCTSHRCVETPKLALNDLEKWLIERPHSCATSESRIRPDRFSLSTSVARRCSQSSVLLQHMSAEDQIELVQCQGVRPALPADVGKNALGQLAQNEIFLHNRHPVGLHRTN